MLELLLWPSWSRIDLQCRRPGLIPGLGRSPREGKGYPLQYSNVENSMDCIDLGVAKSQTRLIDFTFTFYQDCMCQSPPPISSHHPPFPLIINIFVPYICVSISALQIRLYHFSRFHIHALIYDVCFSLYDLLHFEWHALDSLTSFPLLLWISNIALYICTTSLSISLSVNI